MPVYRCLKCGRRVEKPEGFYYCKVCGINVLMVREEELKETLREIYKLYQRGMKERTLMWTPYVAVAKSLERGEIIVERRNKRIVGFLRYGIGVREPACRLLQIYVVPEWRGRGIGRKLVEEFENICKKCRMKSAKLKTGATNISAQKFYEKLGYKPVARLEKKIPEIVYEKTL